jgi:Nucleotidyl transferase AbiEii toxin, Type IV TA system
MEPEKLFSLLQALDEQRVDYYVFGGMALNIHGLVRATEDVDLFVRPDRQNIERLRTAVRLVFPDDPTVNEISPDDLMGPYPAVRYNSLDGTMSVDIVTHLGEAFCFDDLEGEAREFHGIRVKVVTPSMLYRMKKTTVRMKDRYDAAWLKQEFDLKD